MFSDIFRNHLLMNALLAWATAQILKFFIYLAVNRTIDWKRLTGDGGMPSGHSATVTALAVTSGLEYGYDSPIFAVCVVLAIIVMHDAMGVRREAGRHAKAINELLKPSAVNRSRTSSSRSFWDTHPCRCAAGLCWALQSPGFWAEHRFY